VVTQLPRVTVLLATYNGLRWLPRQIETILDQEGVVVRLLVSDDASTDGTREWLETWDDPRITVLPDTGPSGGAAPNFYRLLNELDLETCDLVAFADQDDVWLPGKLAAQAEVVLSGAAEGTSSDVTAFDADGKRHLIRKSFPQRRFDYLLESPGPGCTFVFSKPLAVEVRRVLAEPDGVARSIEFHDWLVYAVCRAHGWPWLIEDTPWVDYRQHESNAMGANAGARSAFDRLKRMRNSWHRSEARKLAAVCLPLATPDQRAELADLMRLLDDRGIAARWDLAKRAGELRRRPRDRWVIGVLTAVGLW
jgi:rhamnosyltransferase